MAEHETQKTRVEFTPEDTDNQEHRVTTQDSGLVDIKALDSGEGTEENSGEETEE